MKFKSSLLIVGAILIALGSCKDNQAADTANQPGLDLGYMDTSVSPKDDFYRYVNGVWIDSTEIPADQTVWGGFNKLRKDTDADVLTILDKAMNDENLDPDSDQAKAVYVYQSMMDNESRNKAGYQPLVPYLEKIENIKTLDELLEVSASLRTKGLNAFFGVYVGPDAMNTEMNVAQLGNGSLGMAREYYVGEDEDSKEKLAKYEDHITRMLGMIGMENAAQTASEIVAFEKAMAQPRLDKVTRRDPRKTYNPMSVDDLQKIAPAIDWKSYFDDAGMKDFDNLIVSQPDYIKALNTMWKPSNLEVMKKYMKWSMLDSSASMLSTDLEDANFDFYSKTMRGAKEQKPQNERALAVVNGTLGEALGQLYVDEKFPPEAKAKAKEMIEYVKKAYEVRINGLEWMSPETKTKAIEKLNGMTIKIGYPDEWKDYSDMEIKSPKDGGTLFDNMLAVQEYNYNDNMSKLGEKVDKTEWFMSPQTVNAYYNPYYNEIVFPAAILQPPFYNYEADPAINFGGMGAVIGHEISHGFDDQGAKFAANGNMTNWWTDSDKEQFETLGKDLAAQYDAIEVLPGVNINGSYTLGENIGDLGGVNAAYDALNMWLEDKGEVGKINDFTQQQRFFLSWATVWRTKMRDEALKQRIKGDTHSPGMYRGYVPLQNIEAFYDAFGIKEGDGMYIQPEDRVLIW
ncbi:putative endopeptidase [Nonlabens dokdonensis]|uniref:Endopeptidase M13 family n=2 Tax=Nonlabens dokdonensis TaxID=328515 RepID=L7W982_NONDD|nr:M13 family metallopeptidase [Nonlabens dokdonensis]AGC76371.1 endopeptidase M13 family [Nonlabens dokdonensis DSW-6]PZX44029.1 putative endopeptidase [Nonlabens dokdonensis]